MSRKQRHQYRRLYYRDGTRFGPTPRRSNLVYAAGKDIGHPTGTTELGTAVQRRTRKYDSISRLRKKYYSSTTMINDTEGRYYCDHTDKLHQLWDGSRKRSILSRPWLTRNNEVRVRFDLGILERAMPSYTVPRERQSPLSANDLDVLARLMRRYLSRVLSRRGTPCDQLSCSPHDAKSEINSSLTRAFDDVARDAFCPMEDWQAADLVTCDHEAWKYDGEWWTPGVSQRC